jgi:hypothetical protein
MMSSKNDQTDEIRFMNNGERAHNLHASANCLLPAESSMRMTSGTHLISERERFVLSRIEPGKYAAHPGVAATRESLQSTGTLPGCCGQRAARAEH